MTTTNQAFINAYRQAAPAVAPIAMMPVATTTAAVPTASASPVRASANRASSATPAGWINSEIATWHVGDNEATDAGSTFARMRIDAPHLDTPDSDSPQSRRVRRRLSDIAAERERFEARQPAATVTKIAVRQPATATAPAALHERRSIAWPDLCAELLAIAAPAYDRALQPLVDRNGHSRLIGVLAMQPDCGCTTTAMCLALRAATLGLEPLLIEGAGTAIAQALQLSTTQGWWPLAAEGSSPLAAIQHDARTGVSILPSGSQHEAPLAPRQLFELATAMGTLRQRHRLIIVDLGDISTTPAAAHARTLLGTMGSDALLAVTRGSDDSLHALQDRLGTHAAQLVGSIATGN